MRRGHTQFVPEGPSWQRSKTSIMPRGMYGVCWRAAKRAGRSNANGCGPGCLVPAALFLIWCSFVGGGNSSRTEQPSRQEPAAAPPPSRDYRSMPEPEGRVSGSRRSRTIARKRTSPAAIEVPPTRVRGMSTHPNPSRKARATPSTRAKQDLASPTATEESPETGNYVEVDGVRTPIRLVSPGRGYIEVDGVRHEVTPPNPDGTSD